jgi:hypothetical protein
MSVSVMRTPDDPSTDDAAFRPEVIFSLKGGFVWASWPGKSAPIKLGRHEAVKAMMQDFLDQSALGERLATQKADDR